ncbi:MAG: DUF2914 domain-containing protein [bacterium]
MIKSFFKLFEKYSRFLSSLGLIAGLIITPLTLTRIDNVSDNLWIIIQLFLAIFGITLLNYLNNKVKTGKINKVYDNDINFWLTLIIQFAFGNLFSTYIVFYFRSSTIFLSWPFILVIAFLLIGNEIWVRRYSRLTLQITTLFLSIYMFFIFSLPIILNKIGDDVFIYSGLLSLLFIIVFIFVLRIITRESFTANKIPMISSLIGSFIIINGMYFLNIIPPIPLSLKDAGVYHSIYIENGNYILNGEEKTWKDYFKIYEVYNRVGNEPVYVFSSIFSPTKFNTEIIHEWQYYNENERKWVTSGRVNLPITGGRDAGFRTYSMKENVFTGLWRVNILTLKNKVVGRVNLEIR